MAVSRNYGDEGVEYGETREIIEVVEEVEEIEESMADESVVEDTPQPKRKINELVTKVDPFVGIPFDSCKKESHAKNMVFEQGQTSEDDEHLIRFSSRNGTVRQESDERIIDRYVEKEPSSSKISLSKMDYSNHSNSAHDSPLIEVVDEEEHQSELHKAHLIQTLQAIQYIKSLPNDHSLEEKYVNFPPHPLFDTPEETKTIIFDLDETLVH